MLLISKIKIIGIFLSYGVYIYFDYVLVYYVKLKNEKNNLLFFFSGFFMFMNSLKNLPFPKPMSEWCPGMYNLIDVF